MERGIIYLLTGRAHAARLVVSLWSLRRHYGGPVTVYTTHAESHAIGQRCACESRLGVTHCPADYVAARRNGSFLTKVKLLAQVPYEVTAYLDADTLVAGNVDALFEVSPAEQFCATQFADWQTTSRKLRQRIGSWRGLSGAEVDPLRLAQLIEGALRPQPAVNGGVFAFHRQAAILRPWYELSWFGRSTFICDEIALQLLLPEYPHQVLDCRYNCSPLYAPRRRDVRIWHLHGEKHVNRPNARSLWLPVYEECLRQNVAGLAEWTPAGDKRLARFLREREPAR